jgi:hypothetical protein
MRLAITPYSIAVAPDRLSRNLLRSGTIVFTSHASVRTRLVSRIGEGRAGFGAERVISDETVNREGNPVT